MFKQQFSQSYEEEATKLCKYGLHLSYLSKLSQSLFQLWQLAQAPVLQLMIMSLIRKKTRPVSPFDFRLFPLQLLLPNFLILHFPVEEIAQVVVMLLALLGKTRDYTFSILLLQLLKQPSFSASFFVFFSACLCSSCSPIFCCLHSRPSISVPFSTNFFWIP